LDADKKKKKHVDHAE